MLVCQIIDFFPPPPVPLVLLDAEEDDDEEDIDSSLKITAEHPAPVAETRPLIKGMGRLMVSVLSKSNLTMGIPCCCCC